MLAPKGGIGEDDLHLLLGAYGVVFGFEAVEVMPVGHVEAVEDEIGEAEHVGDGLQLPAGDGFLKFRLVIQVMDFIFADVVDGCAKETTGAGSGVEYVFAEARVRHLRHKPGDGARRVVLTFVPGIPQFEQDGLIDSAENVAVAAVIKVEAVELVDDLAHLVAGLHVVVRPVENFAHECGTLLGMSGFEIAEADEEAVAGMVDKED